MKHKRRLFALLCTLALCCCVAVTAFAGDGCYASDESGATTPPEAIDSITVGTEGVTLPENQGSETLTPDGNLDLIDDILQDGGYFVSDEQAVANKQFITVQSKNGNYFYLVIDRSGDTENVYFLNLVDDADLLALLEDTEIAVPVCTCADKCMVGSIKTDCEICRTDLRECTGKEKEAEPSLDGPVTEPDQNNGNPAVIALVVLLAAGGSALYWFKFRQPKADTRGADDLDDYDFGEDDEDYEYEKEEE